MKKQPTTDQLEATNSAYKLRDQAQNDDTLAKDFGISKVTLYTRLKTSNWKKSEIALIKALSK